MPQPLKHVGRLFNTDRRVIVAFRQLPQDKNSCLVIDTDAMPDRYHDDFMTTVEEERAQETWDFYKIMERSVLSDGENMLQGAHKRGWLQKEPCGNVVLTPDNVSKVKLTDLNAKLGGWDAKAHDASLSSAAKADQAGKSGRKASRKQVNKDVQATEVEVQELASFGDMPSNTGDQTPGVLGDAELAQQLLAQANGMQSEADRLREEAFELNPSLKPKRGRPKKS